MSDAPEDARSFEVIEITDLQQLAKIALTKLGYAFDRHPEKRAPYAANLLGICLCQGAADHFLHLGSPIDRGVHDFDLWAFYKRQPNVTFWNRRPSLADFGPSKFGRSRLDPSRYVGRRIDVFWRTIWAECGDRPAHTMRRYFEVPQSICARELRKKSVVQIWPQQNAGQAIWDPLP
jgi:hypothetical protein